MTEPLYYKDRYLRSVDAVVTGLSDGAIILDRTIFYPEAGGQPGDRGTFGPYAIRDTQKGKDGEILHILADGSALPSVGERATLTLDWNHRHFFMKEHTAQHLVSALLFSAAGIGTVSVHQGEDGFTIETDKAEIDEDVLLHIEDAANDAIRRGLDVWQDEVSHEEAEALGMRRSIKVAGRVKLVHIDGVDVVGCGGVHVASTSEIGEIAYVSSERIRGHVRTFWKCSERAVEYRRLNASAVRALSVLFSSEPDKLVESAQRCIDEIQQLRHDAAKLSEKAASLLLEAAREKTQDGKTVIFSSCVATRYYEGLISEDDDCIVIVADEEGRFLFHGDKDRFEALRAAVADIRGGGRGMLYRGSFTGRAEEFTSACRSLFSGDGSLEKA